MNTSVRARLDARGFSFVELLVTIVIAGIIFAAMVPVFVGATKKNSSDSARLQAANVAQDKIEKIRQLPYGAIAADKNAANATDPASTTPNFYNRYIADRQFGPYTDLQTGTGTRRIYTDYTVTVYPYVETGLQSQYKLVTVTAYWDAPPAPVKKVVLQTIVYRQYAGPPIDDFSTSPSIDDSGVIHGTGSNNELNSITLTAHVDTTAGVALASLQFQIAAYGGQTIASQLVNVTDVNSTAGYYYDGHGTFYWTWDCSAAATNTVYDFAATATSTDGYAGNTLHLYPKLDHTVLPVPPKAVVATAGDGAVSLSWSRSPSTDIAYYEVFRRESTTTTWTALSPHVTGGATAFRDTTATNNVTYFYAVRTVITAAVNNQSVLAVSNQVTPQTSPDQTAPTAPLNVKATAAPAAATITLTWDAATDPLPNATGVKSYEIFRSADNVSWGTQPLTVWPNVTTLSYPDTTAGWGTEWYYKIRAVDGALLTGPDSSPVVSATTVSQPWHDLKIALASKESVACTVWVLGASDHHYYDVAGGDRGTSPPTGTSIVAAGSVTFSDLPDGPYTVFCDWASGGSDIFGVAVQAPFGDLSNLAP